MFNISDLFYLYKENKQLIHHDLVMSRNNFLYSSKVKSTFGKNALEHLIDFVGLTKKEIIHMYNMSIKCSSSVQDKIDELCKDDLYLPDANTIRDWALDLAQRHYSSE